MRGGFALFLWTACGKFAMLRALNSRDMDKFSHFVFDIDGTLIDTEYAILHSLQDILSALGKRAEIGELAFALGIPGRDALERLGVADPAAANAAWEKRFCFYKDRVDCFAGIRELLDELASRGCRSGIVTSKSRREYDDDFLPLGIGGHFGVSVCIGDAPRPKPFPDPLLKYLKLSGASADEIVFIGDTKYDAACARGAGVKFVLAEWGSPNAAEIESDFRFKCPLDVLALAR